MAKYSDAQIHSGLTATRTRPRSGFCAETGPLEGTPSQETRIELADICTKPRFWLVTIAVLLIAAAALGCYGLYVQASTGDSAPAGMLGIRLPWQPEAELKATPTKTPPLPLKLAVTPTPLQVLPTPTSTATPSETPVAVEPIVEPTVELAAPSATSTPRPPLPDDLLRISREYGLDATGDLVVIDQNQQRMHVMEDGAEIRTLPVSTGDPDSHFMTPAWSGVIGEYWGSFSALGAWADNAWYLFALDGGGTILIHSAPYVLRDGVRTYQELGAVGLYPASRGCIRLLPEDAEWFSAWEPQGVPIVILPWDGGTARQG